MSSVYNIINKTKANTISQKAKVAESFSSRLIGLMFRKEIAQEEALIFYHTPSIHTFFMRFPIDVVFLDKKMQVIKIYGALGPCRTVFCANSFLVIEFPSHKTSQKSLELGDVLELAPASL